MIKTLLFLTAVGLSQAAEPRLTVPHPDCPSVGHHLLPHEYDCTKFYYCERGEKFVEARICPPGTEFSAEQQVCIHPSLANCFLPGAPTDGPSDGQTAAPPAPTNAPNTAPPAVPTAAPTEAPANPPIAPTGAPANPPVAPTGAPANPPVAPTGAPGVPTSAPSSPSAEEDSCEYLDNGCPADYAINKLLPHETSCRGYYQCVHGEKVLRRCARGTVFNPVTERCDHASEVDRTCEDDESPELSSEESQESVEVELLPNGCPANWSIPGYLPHETYCNVYYQCIFGNVVERYCPPGTQFDAELKTCQHADLVNCNLPGGDAVITTTAPPTTTVRPPFDVLDNGCPVDGSINWLLPHEEDCNKFYYCVWGDLVVSQCPSSLHFNPKTQQCDSPANAGCACSSCNTCGNGDASEDCSQENNSAGDNNSDGDDNNSEPDDNNTSEIDDNNTSEVDDNNNCDGNDNNCVVDESSEEDRPGGDDNNVPAPEPECESKEEENNRCEEECNVLPWAHDDCDKYWICDGKKPSLIVCAEGLQFNPATRTCDFACNAGCVRESVQATAGHDGLKLYLPWNKIDDETRALLKLIAH